MKNEDIVKLLSLKKKLQLIESELDSIILSFDIVQRVSNDKEVTNIRAQVTDIDFMLNELILKIQKDI